MGSNRVEYTEERNLGYGIVVYGGDYQVYKDGIKMVKCPTEIEAHAWIRKDIIKEG